MSDPTRMFPALHDLFYRGIALDEQLQGRELRQLQGADETARDWIKLGRPPKSIVRDLFNIMRIPFDERAIVRTRTEHEALPPLKLPTVQQDRGPLQTTRAIVETELTTRPLPPSFALEGQVFNLVDFLYRQRYWSRRTFGPNDGTGPVDFESIIDHIEKELVEIARKPYDLEEWIDVAILAFDGAWRCGIPNGPLPIGSQKASPEAIARALFAKLRENANREWPNWRTVPKTGKAITHVKPESGAAVGGQRDFLGEIDTLKRELTHQIDENQAITTERNQLRQRLGEMRRELDAATEALRLDRERLADAQQVAHVAEAESALLKRELEQYKADRERLFQALGECDPVKAIAICAGGTIEERLPHGSAVISVPLPKDHWIYSRDHRTPATFQERARQAIRATTDYGQIRDFDPDALVQNLVLQLQLAPLQTASSSVRTPPAWLAQPAPSETSIDHPAYYGGADNPYEAIKVIRAWGLGFNLGNVVKYICRAGRKGDRVADLSKAAWYLADECEAIARRRQTSSAPDAHPAGAQQNANAAKLNTKRPTD